MSEREGRREWEEREGERGECRREPTNKYVCDIAQVLTMDTDMKHSLSVG